jgi:hypothetical protein
MVIIASVAKSSVVSPTYSPYRFVCNDDPNLKCRLDAEQGGGRADHQIFLAEVELLLIHGARTGKNERENLEWSSCFHVGKVFDRMPLTVSMTRGSHLLHH